MSGKASQRPFMTEPSPILPTNWELGALAVGILVMYIPTYMALNTYVWNIVGQGHGPIMLALAIWLAWQRLPKLAQLPAARSSVTGSLTLMAGLAMYVIGRSQDILFIDTASQILVLSGIILLFKGPIGLKTMWFPIFFLIFIIPLPGSVVAAITAPLKTGVSHVSEYLLYLADYPIGRSGVTLTIGPYQLLVADACAGINSIFALEAIGVFYMSIANHANKTRNIILASLIIPISFISNVARVIVLVLITYYFGDEAGQGFAHGFAGILLFMAATAFTIGADSLLGLFLKDDSSKSHHG